MKKTALIVYGGWDGHQPKETAALVAHDLEKAGFGITLSDTLDSFLDEARLKTFDLIVPHWTMGQITGDQAGNLIRAIESGVGLGGFHGGMGDAFRSDSGYQFMVGGQFVAHPDNSKDYTVQIVKKADPIVAGLSDFAVHSEQYYMHVDPSNEVLATTTFKTVSAPWVNGTVMPVVWKRIYGQGRVFYQSIGHSTKELEIPEVREITKRGLVWAAR
ncbi:MAG TPA: ThuA domain-containing protein [Candidatus Methylacidiphilales bacterium]